MVLDIRGFGRIVNLTPMSTTAQKSRTRLLSEAAMQSRIHTSRADRDLTGDGLSKVHNEGVAMKVRAKVAQVKSASAVRH